jgi:glycosyltransferase involved in cell wall biosynthesis
MSGIKYSRFRPYFARRATLARMIYVVIPALEEAASLRTLLPRLRAMPEIGRICVVDGGSMDETLKVGRECGALAVDGRAQNIARNRGAQMNAGVAALRAEAALPPDAILWFLHADAQPHKANTRALQRADRDARFCGGNFALRFGAGGAAGRGFAILARMLRACGIYYGDSGIWLRAGVFEQIGSYASWPLFEDYDLARRLEKHARRMGKSTRCLRPPLGVSSRRWRQHPARWLAAWARLQLLFWLGVSPFELARRYHK